VLRDCRLRHSEGPCEACDGVFGRTQLVEKGASGRVGYGAEDITRLSRRHSRILISECLYVNGAAAPMQHLCKL
jgi:hypothetical protein